MKLFLDSHTLLWAIYAPPMLTDRVRELLADKDNELVISHAVLWEILNKVGRGKLLLADTSVAGTMQRIDELGVTFLPIDRSLILSAASLPHHHSDPFDRMVIAQAIANNIPVLTRDDEFYKYDIQGIWQ